MIRQFFLFALCLMVLPVAARAQTVGETIFKTGFDGPNGGVAADMLALPGVKIAPGKDGSQALLVELAETGRTHVMFKLPIEKVRGMKLTFTAMVKAEDVAVPPQDYNGVKVMLHTVSPSEKRWLQQNRVWGTFDWKPITYSTRVGEDVTDAYLILGLENTKGKVWFDDVRVSISGLPRVRPTVKPTGPVYRGHNLPRLRGTMVGMNMKDEDLRVLGKEWGANLIRWQILWNGFPFSPADKVGVAEYDAWMDTELDKLDKALPLCEKYGLMVVVDVHTPPGGRLPDKTCRLFQDKAFQDYFPVLWEKIARRYKGKKIIWGYDLVNEPVEGSIPEGLMNWNQLAALTAKKVYAIDPDHAIIVEPAPWGGVDAINELEIIPLPNVVYSVHMYTPGEFTHQGVHDNKTDIMYPGTINGVKWDKEALRKVLQKVKDFETDYGVHIYIGEFSAIRWAPGTSAHDYLKDVIDLFEEFGWDWSYHAYREWNGWSVEYGPDKDDNKPSATPTDRQKLLMEWFAKNKKPVVK